LKTAKKEKKELDEDELAYREKLKAGMFHLQLTPVSCHPDMFYRCQGQEGYDGGGQGQEGPSEHRPAGHQEVWQEINGSYDSLSPFYDPNEPRPTRAKMVVYILSVTANTIPTFYALLQFIFYVPKYHLQHLKFTNTYMCQTWEDFKKVNNFHWTRRGCAQRIRMLDKLEATGRKHWQVKRPGIWLKTRNERLQSKRNWSRQSPVTIRKAKPPN